jgi:hypothetical protein
MIAMKLSPADLRVLEQAADVADAQRELVRLSNRMAANRWGWLTYQPLTLAGALAIALLSLLTLKSLP